MGYEALVSDDEPNQMESGSRIKPQTKNGAIAAAGAVEQGSLAFTWHSVKVQKKETIIQKLKMIFNFAFDICLNGHQERMEMVDGKIILKNGFGKAMSGQLIAFIGGSGAGKSTLLNFLSMRNTFSVNAVSGSIMLNGVAMKKSAIRSLSAYVQQDIVFENSQTVLQHMEFVANLRMAKSHQFSERRERINELLEAFQLSHCAATKIEKISGGEKKQLAVASELLNYPPILFCDEPTSGLDADKADKMVKLLKETAISQNIIIVITIHQPSFDAFNQFDKVCLLGKGGQMCFFGKIHQAKDFFSSLGKNLPNYTNPAEFYIKKLAREENESKIDFEHRIEEIAQAFRESDLGQALLQECKQTAADPSPAIDIPTLCQRPSSSDSSEGRESSFKINVPKSPKAAGFFLKIWFLFWRSICITFKNPLMSKMMASSMLVPAFLGATSCWEPINQQTVMNFNGRLYLCISTMNFMYQFLTINMVCEKLPVYLNEYSANLYGFSTFFLAKNLADLFLFTICQCAFAAIFHVLAEQTWNWGEFAVFLACCVAIANVAVSIGYFFAFATFSAERATAILPTIMIPLLSFSGFFLNRSTLHFFVFKWIDWISYFGNAFEIMAVNKWRRVGNITGCVYEWNPTINLEAEQGFIWENEMTKNGATIMAAIPKHCYRDGKDVLDSLDFSKDNLLFDWCLLLGIIIVFRLGAYFALFCNSVRKS